jgi:hypothetical protein
MDPLYNDNISSTVGASLSLKAILAGVVITVWMGILCGLLAAGLSPLHGMNAYIGVLLSSMVIMGLGGWVAARLAPQQSLMGGMVHGILVCGLVTLLIPKITAGVFHSTPNQIWMIVADTTIEPVGSMPSHTEFQNELNARLEKLFKEVEALAPKASAAVSKNKDEMIKQLQSLLGNNLEDKEKALNTWVETYIPKNTQEEFAELRTKLSSMMDDLKAQYMQWLKQAGDKFKHPQQSACPQLHKKGALLTFFALLLNTIAAALGGLLGTFFARKEDCLI